MKITFVRPGFGDRRGSDVMEPLVFAILTGLTPPDIELELYDERVERVPFDIETDLVAMTVETYTARRSYQLASRFRARDIPVIMGGFHPTFLPLEALQYADSVVVGDAEAVWPVVVEDLRHDRLRPLYHSDVLPSLDQVSVERRLFAGKRYSSIGLVQAGRGCRYACDFCSIHAAYGTSIRRRPLKAVVAELAALKRGVVFFVDDNLFVDRTQARALFEAIRPLRLSWTCQTSIDVSDDPGLLALMAKSGCINALIGFESLNERNLRQMKKRWNLKHGDYATAIAKFRDQGIMLYATFVFGYDADTPDAFDITLDFALRSKFCLANFNPLTPTPGAALYDRLQQEGRLRYGRWWLDPAYRYGEATFHPRGMTAEQLTEGCFRSRRRFNAWSSIAHRAMDSGANGRSARNLSIYLLGNMITRREIYRKQGMPLSDPHPLPGEEVLA